MFQYCYIFLRHILLVPQESSQAMAQRIVSSHDGEVEGWNPSSWRCRLLLCHTRSMCKWLVVSEGSLGPMCAAVPLGQLGLQTYRPSISMDGKSLPTVSMNALETWDKWKVSKQATKQNVFILHLSQTGESLKVLHKRIKIQKSTTQITFTSLCFLVRKEMLNTIVSERSLERPHF